MINCMHQTWPTQGTKHPAIWYAHSQHSPCLRDIRCHVSYSSFFRLTLKVDGHYLWDIWLHYLNRLPSVLWRCWLGGRKGIQPVKIWVVGWLSAWSEVQTCTWPSWCHCHSLCLASVKSRLVYPFWYRPTWVVPEKGPLNGCVCACVYLNRCLTAIKNVTGDNFAFSRRAHRHVIYATQVRLQGSELSTSLLLIMAFILTAQH